MTNDPKPKAKTPRKRGRPAKTPEEIENRLISLAYKEAERQIKEGRASATTINHFLKLGSTRDQLEKAKLEAETELAKKKVEDMQAQRDQEKLAERAFKAFKAYSGNTDEE